MPRAAPDYSFKNGVDNLEICEHSLADGRGRGRKSIISSFIIPSNRKRGSAREKPQFIDKMKRESVMAVSQAIKSKLKRVMFFPMYFLKKKFSQQRSRCTRNHWHLRPSCFSQIVH